MEKQCYKKVMSHLRKRRPFDKIKLVNLLINLKSHGVNIYFGENKRQLRYILKGQKTMAWRR